MRVFLLGPGYYAGEESRRALHDRLRLAESLAPHEVSIMEFDGGQVDSRRYAPQVSGSLGEPAYHPAESMKLPLSEEKEVRPKPRG